MPTYNRDLTNLWASLSDAWGRFEDKDTIEALWEGIAGGADMLMGRTMDVQNSRTMEFMPPIIDDGPMQFNIIESGTGSNVVQSGTGDFFGPGLFKTYIDDYTISIPTLTQNYVNVATSGTHTYVEGTDYMISGMNTLVWLTEPVWDTRYPSMHVLQLNADYVKRINPILMNLWARLIDLELDEFNQYNIYQIATDANKYNHLKYFIWSLFYKRLQSPTIKNLEDALNIANGMPFAYDAGTAVVVGSGVYTNITIGDQMYTLPSGLDACVVNGQAVEKFDSLAKGIRVYDYYNSSEFINSFSNVLTKYNTIIIYSTIRNELVGKSTTFFSTFKEKLLPMQFLINSVGPIWANNTLGISNSTVILINE